MPGTTEPSVAERNRERIPKALCEMVVRLYTQNVSVPNICSLTNVSSSSVYRILSLYKKSGIAYTEARACNSGRRSKLSRDDLAVCSLQLHSLRIFNTSDYPVYSWPSTPEEGLLHLWNEGQTSASPWHQGFRKDYMERSMTPRTHVKEGRSDWLNFSSVKLIGYLSSPRLPKSGTLKSVQTMFHALGSMSLNN